MGMEQKKMKDAIIWHALNLEKSGVGLMDNIIDQIIVKRFIMINEERE